MYIIRNPYNRKLIRPKKVTLINTNWNDYYYLEEYPLLEDDEENDDYSMMVSKDDLYLTKELALEALVNELIFSLKSFNSHLNELL